MAIAALNRLFVDKGLHAPEEVALASRKAEATLSAEDNAATTSPANRDAIAFPVRLLQLANRVAAHGDLPSFVELAESVGETKQPYNDQQ